MAPSTAPSYTASTPFPAPGSLGDQADSTADKSSDQETSYTPLAPQPDSMATAAVHPSLSTDIDAIGSHCQLPYCHVLDFLPFRCESCRGVFCLDHRTETSHKCPHGGAWARRRAEETRLREAAAQGPSKTALRKAEAARRLAEGDPLPTECCQEACQEKINSGLKQGIRCDICAKHYCLRHRLQEDHRCTPPRSVQEAAAKASKQAMLDRFRKWSLARTTKMLAPGDRKRKGGGQVAARTRFLAELKREARGDAKVPVEKRLYLVVEAEALPKADEYHAVNVPSRKVFVNKEWKIGRVLDVAARELGVENRNNMGGGEEERLRVFHVEGGRVLGFGEAVGDGVGVGDTLVLLRGIGGVEGL